MIARCIHLDTRDPAFTPLGQVEMQHLDLAINVYEGEDRKSARSESAERQSPGCELSDAPIPY